MKVALIVGGFTSQEGRHYVPTLVDMTTELGSRVELHVFMMRFPLERGRSQVDGAQVHTVGAGFAKRGARIPMMIRTVADIIAEHRRGRFDVLHALGVDECGAVALAAGRLCGIPRVITVMGGELVGYPDLNYGSLLTRSNMLLGRLALRGAQRVTAAGLPVAWQIEAALPRSHHGKIVGISLGIDPAPFDVSTGQPPTDGEFRLVHVAGLRPPKDQSVLLDAFELVVREEPRARLHIAGDGPLRSALEAQASALGLTEYVTFHGILARAEIADFYRSGHVFVFSSRNEGHPIAAIEAALSGIPMVSTHVGIFADLAPHGALTVPLRDPVSLAAAILRMRDPELRRSTAASAADIVRREYTAARSVDKLLAVYADIIRANAQVQ